MINILKITLLSLIIIFFSACVKEPLVPKNETLSIKNGYLYGTIDKVRWESGADIGIVIRNEFGYEMVIIPSSDDKRFLVKIRPGKYYIFGVAIVSGLTKSSPKYYPFTLDHLNIIEVKSNEVSYIGDFVFVSQMFKRNGWARHVFILNKVKNLYEQANIDFQNTFKKSNKMKLVNKYNEDINFNLPIGIQQLCNSLTGCSDNLMPLKIINK